MCNGTRFTDFSREVHVPLSTATGSERDLSQGTDVVLEVVRMRVNEKPPAFMSGLYPGLKASDPRSHVSLGAMWRALFD